MEKVLNGGTRWRTGAGEDGNRSMSRSGEMHPKSHFWAFLRVVKVEKLWFDPFSLFQCWRRDEAGVAGGAGEMLNNKL